VWSDRGGVPKGRLCDLHHQAWLAGRSSSAYHKQY
jgi:hypothetical protein